MSDQEIIISKIETYPYTSIDKKTTLGNAFSFEILDLVITAGVGALIEGIIAMLHLEWKVMHFNIFPLLVIPAVVFIFLAIVVIKWGKPENFLTDYLIYSFYKKYHFKKEED